MPNTYQLDTNAIRITPDLLGDASIHILDFSDNKRLLNGWKLLVNRHKDTRGKQETQPPYSIVSTVLRGYLGGYARFDPHNKFLVTQDPVEPKTLTQIFTYLHALIHGVPFDEVDLSDPPMLAEAIGEQPMRERLLAEYLFHSPGGQPTAEPWVWHTASLDIARRISELPWNVDGQTIPLRPDSSGGLIAWDDPWSNKSNTRHALCRVRFQMKTVPGISNPLLLTGSTATRLQPRLQFARTVLAEQAEAGKPILEIELDGRGRVRTINRLALDVLARIGVDRSVLHSIDAQAQLEAEAYKADTKVTTPPGNPGKIRAIQSKPFKFPIGTGVGMHHMRELIRHIHKALGDHAASPHIVRAVNGFGLKNNPKSLLSTAADTTRSLDAMGFEKLRLVCLWSTDESRLRMADTLCHAYGLQPASLDPIEGEPVDLYDGRVSAVFHHVPAFLAHGPVEGRAQLIDGLDSLRTDPETLIGAWAETEWSSDGGEEGSDSETDDHEPAEAPEVLDEEDAKFQTRRILTHRGIVVQYMAARRTKKPVRPPKDFPALMSLLDLSRQLGILDTRVDEVLVDDLGPHRADKVAHVGIHVRRQAKQKGERNAKICITAAAVVPPALDGEAWTMHGWSYTDRRWLPYHRAAAAFHATDYPAGKLTELDDSTDGFVKAAKEIDMALGELRGLIGTTTYTVMVDAVGTRRLWKGLQNVHQGETPHPGTTWLPGSTLGEDQKPFAVVRLNKSAEVPAPTGVTVLKDDATTSKLATTSVIYQATPDLDCSVWYLSNVPHQFDGSGSGRMGEKKTRWTAVFGSKEDKIKSEVSPNWYTMNATEIYPVATNEGIDRGALAFLAARLCHKPLAWAQRTRYPLPLHAAQQMDLDHPQYRRTAPNAALVEADSMEEFNQADSADTDPVEQ